MSIIILGVSMPTTLEILEMTKNSKIDIREMTAIAVHLSALLY